MKSHLIELQTEKIIEWCINVLKPHSVPATAIYNSFKSGIDLNVESPSRLHVPQQRGCTTMPRGLKHSSIHESIDLETSKTEDEIECKPKTLKKYLVKRIDASYFRQLHCAFGRSADDGRRTRY